MKKINLYKFKREDGSTVISPNKPDEGVEYTNALRLIADSGKLLTKDGVKLYTVIDTNNEEGWHEVDAPEDTSDEE